MNPRILRRLLILNALTALGAAVWTLATPSEPEAARLLGYSYARLGLAGACLLMGVGLAGMAWHTAQAYCTAWGSSLRQEFFRCIRSMSRMAPPPASLTP